MSKAVGRCGRIICLEARAETYRCLYTRVSYHHLANAAPVHVVVSVNTFLAVRIKISDDYRSDWALSETGFSATQRQIL